MIVYQINQIIKEKLLARYQIADQDELKYQDQNITAFFNTNFAGFSGDDQFKEGAYVIKMGGQRIGKFGEHIGSDEVGTGSYFGPIVVVSCAVKFTDIPYLLALKVGDSKKISDNVILKLAPQLIKRLKHKTLIIDNNHYNQIIQKHNHINVIKAIAHNKALLDIYKKTGIQTLIIDQFVNKDRYFDYLKYCKEVVYDVDFVIKAESKYLAVAASSIIARYYFIKALIKDSQKINIALPSGASSNVDQVAQQIIDLYGVATLKNYVKWDFKNSTRLKY